MMLKSYLTPVFKYARVPTSASLSGSVVTLMFTPFPPDSRRAPPILMSLLRPGSQTLLSAVSDSG